jgi:ketosteroid isomerase-like protein
MRGMAEGDPEGLIRAFYEAFNRRNFDAAEPLVDERITVEETRGFNPNAGTYRGLDGARAYFEGWFRFWETVHIELLEIATFERADRLATRVRVTVVGRESALEIADEWGHVIEVRDGKVFRFTLYRSAAEAFAAAAADR